MYLPILIKLKKFDNPEEMNNHMIENHKLEEIKFECKNCSGMFYDADILDWHCLEKHKIQQFSCQLCCKILGSKSVRKRHMSHTHGDKTWGRRKKIV